MDYKYFFTCDSKLFSHRDAAKTKYWKDEALAFLQFLPNQSKKVLEVACGEGMFTTILRKKYSRVEGADLIDRKEVMHVQDYSQEPVRNDKGEIIKYDLTVIKQGLEHVLDYLGCLWNMTRNTKVQGHIAIDFYRFKKFVPSMLHYFHRDVLIEIMTRLGCRLMVVAGHDAYEYILFLKIKECENPYQALLCGAGPMGSSEAWSDELGEIPEKEKKKDIRAEPVEKNETNDRN